MQQAVMASCHYC